MSIKTNIGLYTGFGLCFLLLLFIICVGSIYRANMYKELRKYIYNDCKMFDRSTNYIEDYFTKNPRQGIHNTFYDNYNYDNFNDELFFNDGAFRGTMRSAISDQNVNVLNIKVHDNNLKTNTIDNNELFDIMKLNDNINIDGNNSAILQNNYIQDSNNNDRQFNEQETIQNDKNHSQKSNLPILEHITIKDISSLTEEEKLLYDRRTCYQYIRDKINSHHTLFSMIFKHSILDFSCIRCAKFVFIINQMVGFNALLYFDNYIENNRELNTVYLYLF
jgi:hypothetical protein